MTVCPHTLYTPQVWRDKLQLYWRHPRQDFELRHVDVQRQVGGSDCGLFALAFATALCSGLDPFACSYKQMQMRSHLLFWELTNDHLSISWSPQKACTRHVLSTKRVPVYCVCRLPWNKYDKKRGPLVKCNSCKTWYHQSWLKNLWCYH